MEDIKTRKNKAKGITILQHQFRMDKHLNPLCFAMKIEGDEATPTHQVLDLDSDKYIFEFTDKMLQVIEDHINLGSYYKIKRPAHNRISNTDQAAEENHEKSSLKEFLSAKTYTGD